MISEPSDDLLSGKSSERRQTGVLGLGRIHLALEVLEKYRQLVLGEALSVHKVDRPTFKRYLSCRSRAGSVIAINVTGPNVFRLCNQQCIIQMISYLSYILISKGKR